MTESKVIIHMIVVFIYTAIVLVTFSGLIFTGYGYYLTSVEERYFHDLNNTFKSSGLYGHGFRIMGPSLIVLGVSS